MWTCLNCGTENEENFKFCWSCGHTREQSKSVEVKEEIKPIPKQPEPKNEPVRQIKKVEEIKKPVEEIKPAEITKVEKRKSPPNEPELFATVLPYSAKSSAYANSETDWEIRVFRIAVRLVGLFLLYQVFVALPDLLAVIYSSVKTSAEFSDALTGNLIFPIGKLLFYFIVGIYLIASGRILLCLLPYN